MEMESMVMPTMAEHAHDALSASINHSAMPITHYIELLMVNQPWNILFFMVIPVLLAETLTATEFFVAFRHEYKSPLRKVNRIIGITLGIYFTIIVMYLMVTVIPSVTWRGAIDIIAVVFYILGFIPLLGIALLELRIIKRTSSPEKHMIYHMSLLIIFLVFAHIAMIFGMLNPALAGYNG